jgi:hypothetical protein
MRPLSNGIDTALVSYFLDIDGCHYSATCLLNRIEWNASSMVIFVQQISLLSPIYQLSGFLFFNSGKTTSLNFVIYLSAGGLPYFAGFYRVFVTGIFAVSFVLQPIRQFFLALTAKVIESDRPVFGMVFGAIAFLAKGTEWVVAWLWR